MEKPEDYIRKSSVLIDIDADIANDVFISSKLIQYLSYDRTILCISPENSPARKLLQNKTKTVIISGHKQDDILSALVTAGKLSKTNTEYSEREQLLNLFDIETIVAKWNNSISGIKSKLSI